MTVPSLLPSNRTDFERAVSLTGADRYPLPTELVASVFNADTCPPHLLGYLAWALSVDVWEESWDDVKKRGVCRRSLELHRIKTTLAGIKEHVALTGATVRRAIRPPASGFRRGAMTEEQRANWLDSLPQVRIYPFYRRSIAIRRHFFSGPGGRQFHSSKPGGPVYLVDETGEAVTDDSGTPIFGAETHAVTASVAPIMLTGFLRHSRGTDLLGRRATLYDRGVEVEATYETNLGAGIERVRLPGLRRNAVWQGRGFLGQGFRTAGGGEQNVVTLHLDDGASSFAIERGSTPIDVRPTRVAAARTAPDARSFFGRFRHGRFMKASFAPLMIYDRISLHDPSRLGARRKVRTFHGHGRYGIAAFTAELRIEVPMARASRRSGRFHGAGFRMAADMAALSKAIEAVRVSKAFRDTVYIDTAVHGTVEFNGGLKFGDFTFGEVKRAA